MLWLVAAAIRLPSPRGHEKKKASIKTMIPIAFSMIPNFTESCIKDAHRPGGSTGLDAGDSGIG
jgi:hypothetical protein